MNPLAAVPKKRGSFVSHLPCQLGLLVIGCVSVISLCDVFVDYTWSLNFGFVIGTSMVSRIHGKCNAF